MFDIYSDMFKPIIEARLIRKEAEEQGSLKELEKNTVKENVNLELGEEMGALQVKEKVLDRVSKRGNIERG